MHQHYICTQSLLLGLVQEVVGLEAFSLVWESTLISEIVGWWNRFLIKKANSTLV